MLCARCDQGFRPDSFSGECKECESKSNSIFITILLFLLVVCVFFAMCYVILRGDNSSEKLAGSQASYKENITNIVYLLAFPLWAGKDVVTDDKAAAIVARLAQDDMRSAFGIRSTASSDPAYNNRDLIIPYSNWQGPVWVVANSIICYGLLDHGYQAEAVELAQKTLKVCVCVCVCACACVTLCVIV